MASPLHHDVGSDAEGEGIDDEGAAAGVGADEQIKVLIEEKAPEHPIFVGKSAANH